MLRCAGLALAPRPPRRHTRFFLLRSEHVLLLRWNMVPAGEKARLVSHNSTEGSGSECSSGGKPGPAPRSLVRGKIGQESRLYSPLLAIHLSVSFTFPVTRKRLRRGLKTGLESFLMAGFTCPSYTGPSPLFLKMASGPFYPRFPFESASPVQSRELTTSLCYVGAYICPEGTSFAYESFKKKKKSSTCTSGSKDFLM